MSGTFVQAGHGGSGSVATSIGATFSVAVGSGHAVVGIWHLCTFF